MDKETRDFTRKVIIASLIIGIAYLMVSHFSLIMGFIRSLISAFSPLLLGIVIAFILNAPLSRLEAFIKNKKPDMEQKWVRRISVIRTYLAALLIIVLLISIILPQLAHSVITLANNLPVYITSVVDYVNKLLKQMNLNFRISLDVLFKVPIEELGTSLAKWIEELTPTITEWISGLDPSVVSDIGQVTLSIIKAIIKVCFGVVFSVYILLSKEKFKNQVRRILEAFLPESVVSNIRYLLRKTEQVFSDFVSGQLVEMSILGSIFFIALSIANMPYALLISVVIALTSIIPYFGSATAVIFGAILILAVSGLFRMIIFIVMFLVIQQIDNNLIYPNVVGSSVGLPPVLVLLAVTVFGSMFGFAGLLVAVPTMALLYTLFSDLIQNRLDRKEAVKRRLSK
ncbi:MAG: AI-2E family transporter [Erysipelotrichaceae bacterium]|nr:AI-2E family transporter [Erysipelotrichaceae bacterium]